MKVVKKIIVISLMSSFYMQGSQNRDDFLNRAAQRIVEKAPEVNGKKSLPSTLPACADLFERSVSPVRAEDSQEVMQRKSSAKELFNKLRDVKQEEQDQTRKDLEWGFKAFQYRVSRYFALIKINAEIDQLEKEKRDV